MQQGLPTSDLLEGKVDVSLGGKAVDPVDLSVDREFADSLPGGGQFTAASGRVSYVPGPDVSDRVATPWDPTPGVPMVEEAVTVSMDVGLGPVSVLPDGRVSDTNAASDSRVSTVGFTDLYRSLDRDISWEPMAARMPAEGDAAYWRNPGLFGVSIVDRIFRHCGWYATPPRGSGVAVSAPMQGSAWPEVGTLTRAERLSAPGAAPGWITSPWGMQATDINLTYGVATSLPISTRGVEITAMIPPASSGSARVACWFGSWRLQLIWTETTFTVTAETATDVHTTLVTMARSAMGSASALTARVFRTGAGQARAEIRTNTGESVLGAAVSVGDAVLTTALSAVTSWGDGRLGAFQVGFPVSAWSTITGWSPSVRIRARAGIPNRLQVLPPVINRNCGNLLQELAQAEYATFWIDEKGVMQWWDIDRLEAQPQVATLTTADHVTRLEWSQALSSVYRRAVVAWTDTALDVSFQDRVEFWRGSGGSLTAGAGERIEEIVTAPNDEVWLLPDLSPSEIGGVGTSNDDYNMSVGSWFGGVWDDTTTWSYASHVTMAGIGPGAYKIVTTTGATGTLRTMVQKSVPPGVTSTIWQGRRNESLPILRGKMKYTLLDATTESTQSGPPMAPEFSVDTGWWVQYADEAQWLADKYASRVTIPSPELGAVGIKPAPGLQLGDKITISAPDVVGLQIQGLVYADSRSISAGSGFSMDHTIRVRPIAVSRDSGVTWEEWRASLAATSTHTQWAGTQSGKTWTQWGTAPVS